MSHRFTKGYAPRMFILTCPSCKHRARVKFARMGATAKCVSCRQSFVVDAATLAMQAPAAPAAEGAAAEEVEQHGPVVEELRVEREPTPAEAAAMAAGNALVGESVHSEPVKDNPVTGFFRRRGLDPVLVGLFAMLIVGFAALLLVMVQGDDEDLVVSVDPQVVEAPQPGPSSPAAAGNPKVTPPTTPPVAIAPGPALPVPPAPESPTPGAPGGVNLPSVSLFSSLSHQPTWSRIDPPREGYQPTMESDALVWLATLTRQPDGRGLFTAVFISDENIIYNSGFLYVQLINADGKVYAELKQTVPLLPARQGLEVRVAVPAEHMAGYDRMIAECTPLDPLENVAPLELVERNTRLLSEPGDAAVVQVSISNPFPHAVANPTLVLTVLEPDGWPLGEWRGTLEGQQIGPHDSLTFKAHPPLDAGAQPGRIMLRGYARKQ